MERASRARWVKRVDDKLAWISAKPRPLPAALGSTPLAGPPGLAAGVPAMPLIGGMGHSLSAAPKYGFRPTVVARPPAAG